VFSPLVTFAQQNQRHYVASPSQINEKASYVPPVVNHETELTTMGTPAVAPKGPVYNSNRITAVNAVQLGSASNVFTCLRNEQNQVVAVDSLDLIAFIHRSDLNIFGGSSGKLRYDVSIDGGTSFANDMGELNPNMQFVGRYPNLSAVNPAGNNNPLSAKLIFEANTLDGGASSFDGHVFGAAEIVTSGIPAVTENYAFQGQASYLPGGLCQSVPGVFYCVETNGDGSAPLDLIYVVRGIYNPGASDIQFMRKDTITPNHSLSFDGTATIVGPNIAFSPDGGTGWIAWLGDLAGGPDSTLLPVLVKSTDCGETWGTPIEVNLNLIPWIKDSLQTLWVDSTGAPASDGRASCGFDFDLTVDANGNPHLAVVIGSGIDYSFSSGLAKFLGDVTSNDGGATWDVNYIAPTLTFRTQVFGSSTTVTMDNNVQVARDEGGCNIFYAWADSDTSSANGVGFGESSNLAPNLRIAALNVASGNQTYPRLVTDGDIIWEGAVLFPMMAPIVTSDANGWKLPVVVATMAGGDPIAAATFWYLGNDARIENNSWCDANSMNLSWDFFSAPGFVSPCSITGTFCNSAPAQACATPVGTLSPSENGLVLDNAYPNPTSGLTVIGTSLPAATDLVLTLHNNLGQKVATIANGSFPAGKHQFDLNTTDLPAGIYFYRLVADGNAINKKLVVAH
jgi:hypothetical protein